MNVLKRRFQCSKLRNILIIVMFSGLLISPMAGDEFFTYNEKANKKWVESMIKSFNTKVNMIKAHAELKKKMEFDDLKHLCPNSSPHSKSDDRSSQHNKQNDLCNMSCIERCLAHFTNN